MDFFSKIKVIWTGKCLLSHIKWDLSKFQEYQIPQNLMKEKDSFWQNHLISHPNDYDGNLLFLTEFKNEKDKLILSINYMKFSSAIFSEQNKLSISRGLGVIGCQAIIYSNDYQKILVGNRSINQKYYPGALTFPGGLLEQNDLESSPQKALLREIHEEVSIKVKEEAHLIAILSGWNNISVTFLIQTNILSTSKDQENDEIITDLEEWQSNLRWIPSNSLVREPDENLLDGLIYFKHHLLSNSKN